MGHELYREIRDYAPAGWTSGMFVVAWIIADDANDRTRRSWIDNELLCFRARMGGSGVRAALQKLAKAGYEMRVPHGTDAAGRPVFAVRGHSVDYLVPPLEQLIAATTVAPKSVDNPEESRHHSGGIQEDMATPQKQMATPQSQMAPPQWRPSPQQPPVIPSITKAVDLAPAVENTRDPPGQDHEFRRSRRHLSAIEHDAWTAIGARQ